MFPMASVHGYRDDRQDFFLEGGNLIISESQFWGVRGVCSKHRNSPYTFQVVSFLPTKACLNKSPFNNVKY